MKEMTEIFPELKESKDERIKKVIYGWIYIQPSQSFDNGFSKEEMLAWLEKKGLKKIEQKLAWSEEEEKEVAVLEAYIRSRDWSDRHIQRALGIVDDLVNKVKSLRPQKQWKPSDEQIYAFEKVYDWYNNNFAPSETLTSLYNDFKKLRGE